MTRTLLAIALCVAAATASAAEKGVPRAPRTSPTRVTIGSGRAFMEALLLGPQARRPGFTLGGARLHLAEVPQQPHAEAAPSSRPPSGAPRRPSVSPFTHPGADHPVLRQPASLLPQPTSAVLTPPGGPL